MDNKSIEWIRQAEYDLDTAQYMFDGGRYLYTVFMCHLSVEKMLKALYQKKIKQVPPKTHNLILLLSKMEIKPDKPKSKILAFLTEANISARYPDSLEKLQQNFTREITEDIMAQSKEIIAWIKTKFF